MVIDWFYDKKINVYSYSDDNYDEFGVSCDGYSLKYENIFVDIQPSSAEKLEKSYGYKVEKIIPWDDYYISLLKQEDVNING